MQPRTATREFAIILFCLLGIILLNSYAHNKYRVPRLTDIVQSILPSTDYTKMNLYELLARYAEDPKAVEALEGVEVEGQILKERAVDPTDPHYVDSEKVGKTFRLSRRISESGEEEGSTLLSVEVTYHDPEILAPNMWIRVQGKVRPGKGEGPEPVPAIEAKRIVQIDVPEHPVLSMGGEEGMGDMEHSGHSH